MCLPSHPTSHIVQALDSTPFAQFKKNWKRLLLDYNFEHHGQVVGKGDFFKLLVPAWRHAMTVSRIQSGFRKMGIYPVNFEAIDKTKFTPSQVTDSKKILYIVFSIYLYIEQSCVQLLCICWALYFGSVMTNWKISISTEKLIYVINWKNLNWKIHLVYHQSKNLNQKVQAKDI